MVVANDDSPATKYIRDFAALTIQRYWRGYKCRSQYLRNKTALETARYRLKGQHHAFNVQNTAALIIQNAFRNYRNKRIFAYYRDLIAFRERGDPKELLRSINPREAQLLDAAAGVHIRFRLGGTCFPPLVFYRIFTHRPVTDIGAFGPRNYAAEATVAPAALHNKTQKSSSSKEEFELGAEFREYILPNGTVGYRSAHGWYERQENNGWRPVAERVLVDEDPITTMTRLKRQPMFHYNPAVRKEEKVRQRKQRQREWMMAMYRAGAGTGADEPDDAAIEKARGHLPDLDDADGDDSELVSWTRQLNFDDYMQDWTSAACSLGSEAFLPFADSPYLNDIPTLGPVSYKRAMSASAHATKAAIKDMFPKNETGVEDDAFSYRSASERSDVFAS